MSMDGHGNPHNLTPHGNIPDFRAIVHLPPLAVLPRPTLHGLWLCAIRPNDRRCSAQPPCTPATPAATGLVLVSVRNRPFPSHPRTCPLLQPCQPCLPSTLRVPSLALGRVRFTGTFNGASHVAVRLVMKVLPLAYCNKVSFLFFSFFFSFSPPPT